MHALPPEASRRGAALGVLTRGSGWLVSFVLLLTLSWTGSARAIEVGQILVADRGSNAVLEIDPTTGDQTVLASGAPFVALSGLTFDVYRRVVYVTDHGDGMGQAAAIYRVDPESGVISPVSVGGNLVQPESLLVEPTRETLLVADGLPGRLIRVHLVTGEQTVVASPTAATGLLFAGGSNYYVTKTSGVAIQQIDLNDPLSPLTVGAAGNFQAPTGIGGPIAGLHYVAENSAGLLIEINLAGYNPSFPDANQTPVAQGGDIANPFGVFRENANSVVISDPGALGGAGAVLRYTPATMTEEIVASGGSISEPRGIAVVVPQVGWIERPDIVVTNPDTATVSRWQPLPDVFSTIYSGAPLVAPTGVAVDPVDGRVLVADANGGPLSAGAIFEIDEAGGVTTLTEGGSLVDPVDLELEPDGDVVVADPGAGSILHVDRSSGAQSTLAALGGASAVAVRMDGTVYAAGSSPAQVVRIPAGGGPAEVVASGGSLVGPTGLALDPEGPLVVLDPSGVIRVDPDAYQVGDPGANQTPVDDAGLPFTPTAIDVDESSNYVLTDPGADGGAGDLVTVFRNGGGFAPDLAPALGNVTGIAMDRRLPVSDDVLVLPLNTRRLVRVDPSTGSQRVLSSQGLLSGTTGIAIRDERTAFVSSNEETILLVDLGTGQQQVLGTVSSAGDPNDSLLQDVEIGADGTAWVIDELDGNRFDATFEGRLFRVDPVTLAVSEEIADPLLNGAKGLAIDDAGVIWIVTSLAGIGVNVDKLVMYDPAGGGGVVQVASGSPLIAPGDIEYMPSGPFAGALFISDNTQLLQFDPGDSSIVQVDTGGLLTGAFDAAVDNDMNVLTGGRFTPHNLVRHALGAPIADGGSAPTAGSVDQELVSRGTLISTMAGLDVVPAPEPGMLVSLITGGLALAGWRRRADRVARASAARRAAAHSTPSLRPSDPRRGIRTP